MTNLNLVYTERGIGDMTIPALEFSDGAPSLSIHVTGKVINSIAEKPQQQAWKAEIASAVKAARGGQWNSEAKFAISIGFRFNTDSGWHGYGKGRTPPKMDVENFAKPVVDALAAGLFCDDSTDPRRIQQWDYDDSNFVTLLIHRLPDAPTRQGEGVAICVSASG